MSKRSYRRLAVVAGAALAVGSMAPAMAIRVNATGTGDVDVDVSDLAVPAIDADALIPADFLAAVQVFADGTVSGAQDLVGDTVEGVQADVDGILGLLDATSDLSLDVSGNIAANASSGGATVTVSGVAAGIGDTDLLGLVPDPEAALTDVEGTLSPVVDFGLGTADGAIALAGDAQTAVSGTAYGLLGSGLGLLDSISVSGNANVVAALLASL